MTGLTVVSGAPEVPVEPVARIVTAGAEVPQAAQNAEMRCWWSKPQFQGTRNRGLGRGDVGPDAGIRTGSAGGFGRGG